MEVNLTIRPRLADMVRLAGPAETESSRIEGAMESALEARKKKPRITAAAVFAARAPAAARRPPRAPAA